MLLLNIKKALIEGKFFRKVSSKIFAKPDKYLGTIIRNIVFKFSKIQKNKIFFFTFQGDYTCNPKYITEELLKQNVDCEIVWGVRLAQLKKVFQLSNRMKLVDRYTYDFYKELATSKIWVINSVEIFKNPLYKKNGQIIIETWHGSLGIKRFDKSVNKGKSWVKAAEVCGREADYCISNSNFESNVYKETFWPNTKILKYGHPRNDILFNKDISFSRMIKERLNIEHECKLLLYGPTFRDAHNFDCYNIDFDSLLNALEMKFNGKWKILLRFHPTVRKFANANVNNGNLINVTNYPDIQELMMISDVAITDYSSWIYDFVLSKKPGFIYASDIELYNDERGFYYPLERTPFPIATNNEELIKNILNFDNNKYLTKVEEFLKEKGCVEDGKAAYRVVEKIKEILGDGE